MENKRPTTLKDIKKVIEQSGLTKCENQECGACEFDLKSPQYNNLGKSNICILLNDIYRTEV